MRNGDFVKLLLLIAVFCINMGKALVDDSIRSFACYAAQ